MNFLFYGILVVFLGILFQEILVVDEEMILIVSVLLFLGSSYNTISGFLVTSLNEKIDAIKKIFDNYFFLKLGILENLVITYERIYDTNKNLANVIGVVSGSLGEIKLARNAEVINFFNFVVNLQLQTILVEEIQLLRSVYYDKVKFFFSNLLKNWNFYELSAIAEGSAFDEFFKSSAIVNQNKLLLLPVTAMGFNDLILFSGLDRIKYIIDLLRLDHKFFSSYILVMLILFTKYIR